MKSTQAMRDRCRELSNTKRDDYDRAVVYLIDDLEALEAALRMLIDNVETGSYESTGQAIDFARAALAERQDK